MTLRPVNGGCALLCKNSVDTGEQVLGKGDLKLRGTHFTAVIFVSANVLTPEGEESLRGTLGKEVRHCLLRGFC